MVEAIRLYQWLGPTRDVMGAVAVPMRLHSSDVLVRGIALLVAAVALLPVLRSIAAGSPFRPGHGRRAQVVAVCVVAGAYAGPLLPWLASASVLERLPQP